MKLQKKLIIKILKFKPLANGSKYPVWDRELGITEPKEWPGWCIFVAITLIGVSILWIPFIAICRLFGIVIIEDSEPMLFPAAELRDVNGIVPHEPTEFEQVMFGFRPDGTEGMCFSSFDSNPEVVLQEDE